MKSGSCVKPGGRGWWVGPSFRLGRASRGESRPNWHHTIRVPATARDKRLGESSVVFRSAGTGRRGGSSEAREHVTATVTCRSLAG